MPTSRRMIYDNARNGRRADRVVRPYIVIASQCSHWRGERAVRCRWQMKHGERVAAVKISAA